jgi:HEAT repeat protein
MSDSVPDGQPGATRKKSRRFVLWLVLGIVGFMTLLYGGGVFWHQQTHSVSALMAKLGDKDPSVRMEAAQDLGGYGPAAEAAIPALVERLADDSIQVRHSAESALRRIDRDWFLRPEAARAIPHLIERLAAPGLHGVPGEAASALGRFGPTAKDAVPALLRCLTDESLPAPTRTQAAYALGDIGPAAAAAIPALTDCLVGDAEADVRMAAPTALGKIGHAALPSLIECLRHPASVVRIRALIAFKHMEDPPPPASAIPALVERLGDEEKDVRDHAADVFRSVGPKAVPALVHQLKTGKDTAREWAIYALKSLAPASADDTLQVVYDRLKKRDRAIYRAAVLVLEEFDAEWASKPTAPLLLHALIHCLEDDEWSVRIHAADLLRVLGPTARDALPALRRQAALEKDEYWKEDYQKAIRAIETPQADKP